MQSTPPIAWSCRVMPSPEYPPNTATRSSTTRCRCWRPSPAQMIYSRAGANTRRRYVVTVTDAADTAPAARGGFPDVRPVEDAPPELGRFVSALRRLQDLTVSTNPGGTLWAEA